MEPPVFTIHTTKKLQDRVKQPIAELNEADSALGNWYATALFWKPQVALFVNERTLLPVFTPLAPASALAQRFPDQLRRVLDAHGVDPGLVDHEIRSMGEGQYAKTASRSLLGVMNEFTFFGNVHREDSDHPAPSVRRGHIELPIRFLLRGESTEDDRPLIVREPDRLIGHE